jgi:predicted nucleotidyltransferase
MPEGILSLAADVAARYGALAQVEAVALAGSRTAGVAARDSDLDLYVYAHEEIPLAARAEIATARAERAELDNRFWEPGDEWIESGAHFDVMFRRPVWIEGELDRLLRRHEASLGYSTCLWHNVLSSTVLFDRGGWFASLQRSARQPYPEALRCAIIAKNHPILARTMSSYLGQLKKAVARADLVSQNHRVSALLASYFDILLAVNRLPHPGEKRLLAFARERCAKLPEGMSEGVEGLVRAAPSGDERLIARAEALIDALDALLEAEGLTNGGYRVRNARARRVLPKS